MSAATSWPYKSARYCGFPLTEPPRMEKMSPEKLLLITVFNVLVPSLDQATDINMVKRLMDGPEDQLHVYSGELFLGQLSTKYPFRQYFVRTFWSGWPRSKDKAHVIKIILPLSHRGGAGLLEAKSKLSCFCFSVLNFPTRQVFNGSFSDQINSVQSMHRMVIFNCYPSLGCWTVLFARPICFLEWWSLVLFSWLIFFPVWLVTK